MSGDRWQRIKETFSQARELLGEERDSFLHSTLGDDPEAMEEVRSLLDADSEKEEILDQPSLIHTEALRLAPLPETIGPYRIERLLGQGGMGQVFLASQNEPIRRQVALKLVSPGLGGEALLARFDAERQVLAVLDHPGIARVYDAGVGSSGQPYFVMEFVDGVPLRNFSEKEDLGTREKIEIFVQVCDAVQHAHHNGVVHRDLKPSNILVGRVDGVPVPKVIDFGVAKVLEDSPEVLQHSLHTEVGQLLGTPEYMSPEQVDPSHPGVDTRSDVYSLGVVLYELLTGALPFSRSSGDSLGFLELQRQILQEEPSPAVGLPAELVWILQRTLEKDRRLRYSSASELAADLRRHLEDLPIEAGPQTAGYRLRKFVHRNRALVAAAGAIVLLLVGGISASTWFAVQADRERSVAETRLDQMTEVYDFLIEDLIVAPNPWNNARDIRIVDVLDSASASLDEREFDNPPIEAALRYALGSSYGNLSQGTASEAQLVRALELLEAGENPDPMLVLEVRHRLGRTYQILGKNEEAIAALDLVIEGRTRLQGPDHPRTLSARLHHLTALDRIDFDRALIEARAILADFEALPEPDGRTTLSVRMTVAPILGRHPENFKEAEEMLRAAIELGDEFLGSEDSKVIETRDQLAYNLLRQGHNLDEAESLYRQTYAAFERLMGPDHAETRESQFNLAACLMNAGFAAEARTLVEDLWERRDSFSSAELRNAVVDLLANLQLGNGELEAAEALLREGITPLGHDAGDVEVYRHSVMTINYARVLEQLERYGEAEGAFVRGIDGLKRVVGETTWEPQQHTRRLCTMYLKRSGEPEKAVPMLRESVRVLLDDLGPSDTGTQPSVLLLAEAYRALQQWDQAESTLVRYEELLLATPGYDEKIVEVVRDHLAETRAARTEN